MPPHSSCSVDDDGQKSLATVAVVASLLLMIMLKVVAPLTLVVERWWVWCETSIAA